MSTTHCKPSVLRRYRRFLEQAPTEAVLAKRLPPPPPGDHVTRAGTAGWSGTGQVLRTLGPSRSRAAARTQPTAPATLPSDERCRRRRKAPGKVA